MKQIHTETLVLQVVQTATTLERRLDSALSFTRGITFSEYRLLKAIKEAEHGLTRVTLAELLFLSPSGVTRALKPLEKLGYVQTVKNERDARQSLAVLTPGGHELLSDVREVLADFHAELNVAHLDEAQLATTATVLAELSKR